MRENFLKNRPGANRIRPEFLTAILTPPRREGNEKSPTNSPPPTRRDSHLSFFVIDFSDRLPQPDSPVPAIAEYRNRSCGRVAEGDGLLNRCTALKPYRGFESLRLRLKRSPSRSDKFILDSNKVRSPRASELLLRRSPIPDSAASGGGNPSGSASAEPVAERQVYPGFEQGSVASRQRASHNAKPRSQQRRLRRRQSLQLRC